MNKLLKKDLEINDFNGNPIKVNVAIRSYRGKATALQLDEPDGPYGTVSLFAANHSEQLPPNQCFVKDYSENEHMIPQLVAAGIINLVEDAHPSGYPLYEIVDFDKATDFE